MRRVAIYAGISGALIALLWFLFSLVYTSAVDRRALVASASIAFVVQIAAFALLARMRGSQVMIGWTAGVLLRFVVLAVYALVVLKPAGLPANPALISLATFFVTCTFIEPFLLGR